MNLTPGDGDAGGSLIFETASPLLSVSFLPFSTALLSAAIVTPLA